jgi:hypothetical protein
MNRKEKETFWHLVRVQGLIKAFTTSVKHDKYSPKLAEHSAKEYATFCRELEKIFGF